MNSSTHITINISRGWLTTYAATGIGLVLGVLYVWSVIKSGIPDSWDWSNADKALPYSIMTIAFSFTMVPAGRLQDLFGSRMVISLGGFLAGLGCVIAGLGGSSLVAYIIGFGLVTGMGVGCGYCALAPAAMRWFPPQKTGLIVGIVVSGIGMAPVFLAPLSTWSLTFFQTIDDPGVVEKGVSATMIGLGLVIWVVVGLLVGFIQHPPVGFTPRRRQSRSVSLQVEEQNMTWKQMISTGQFWLLFSMFFAGSSTGLIFISVATDLGRNALGTWAFIAVIVLSFGNSGGRLLGGGPIG